MKRFLILCVTYHSYEELKRYVASVDEAVGKSAGEWLVDICVADNTDKDWKDISLDVKSVHSVRPFAFHENLGYFGAVQRMMKDVEHIADYDFVAISNVDLDMPADFFQKLGSMQFADNVGWVANAILSGLENRDRNPKIMKRYSEKRLKQLRFLFKYPVLHYLYQRTLYLRKRAYASKPAMDIYAGHGSFVLLTRAFVSKYPLLDYPVFLFCEEIYLAELCAKAGLVVRYEPSLIVRDTEHCSTGKMRKSFYYKCNYEAIDYILRTYYVGGCG